MNEAAQVIDAMIAYYEGDPKRVGHFLKVYGFAKAIGEMEQLGGDDQSILELAAITHDIGIKNSELKYGSASGRHQETEGPPEAEKLLASLGIERGRIERVKWLIAHHHTYGDRRDIAYQILIEADFLVNAYEDAMTPAAVRGVREKVFKTQTGTRYLDMLYKTSDFLT
jgi:predicted metal-dependent HD superfamily phosphohydrolase